MGKAVSAPIDAFVWYPNLKRMTITWDVINAHVPYMAEHVTVHGYKHNITFRLVRDWEEDANDQSHRNALYVVLDPDVLPEELRDIQIWYYIEQGHLDHDLGNGYFR